MRSPLVLFVALMLLGCDDSKKRYGEALKKYEALIIAGRPVSDPAYDEVVEALDAANTDDAAKLAASIRRLRTPMQLPPRPLARANGEGDDEAARKAAECAELAKAVGTASDAGRSEAIARLQACRVQLEKLNVARLHAQDPLGHAHVGHEDAGPQ